MNVSANHVKSDNRIKLNRAVYIQHGVAILAFLLVIAPLSPILFQSFLGNPIYEEIKIFTFANFEKLLTNAKFYSALSNSVILAVCTTIIALVIGVSTAVLLGRTNVPMRRTFGEMVLLPMYVSHLVLAFGWFVMYGPSGYITLLVKDWFDVEAWNLYTIIGMSVVAGAAQAPMVHLLCSSSAAAADASLEDAARTAGAGPFTLFWRVTIPLLRPSII